ncbi:DciA family protein [uncultured Neisseria sp.]|uniref:DciA family protein n=1 Tax=uncultured Neisseria sp. TaxID=237778 RepID=UPI0025CDB556|nr:DciA family protein [uncultured Neisseria sp.]
MDLAQLGKRDHLLAGLLQQSQQWRKLDAKIKTVLPANLHPHFQTACVEDGRLVLLAANNMAASRLKMILPAMLPKLQELHDGIREVAVRVIPKPPPHPKTNSLRLSEAALDSFDTAAAKLEGKYPELAAALAELVRKHSH